MSAQTSTAIPELSAENGSDEPPPCICGHAKADHLGRMDDCTVKGCPCPLYALGKVTQ